MSDLRKHLCMCMLVMGIVTMLVVLTVVSAGANRIVVVDVDLHAKELTASNYWWMNDGNKSTGLTSYLAFLQINEDPAYIMSGTHSLEFTIKPQLEGLESTWFSCELGSAGYWTSNDWDFDGHVYAWIKGDGSGRPINIVLNVPGLGKVFGFEITLDSVEWKEYKVPISDFATPEWAGDVETVEDYAGWVVVTSLFITGATPNPGDEPLVFYVDRIEVDSKK